MQNAAKRRVPYGNYDREPRELKRGIRKVREDGLGAGWSNLKLSLNLDHNGSTRYRADCEIFIIVFMQINK